jgi:DNA polymerase-1
MERLFLIDGTALAYRSYFAFAGSSSGGLTTKDGKPTSAIYGFTTTLRSLLEREKPDRIAIAFDIGPTEELERTKLYPDYKSTREKAPDEMLSQLDDIERVVRAHGIPIVHAPGHEADDVIATLAVQGRDRGMEVFLVTGDKDFMQIVDEHIKLWNLRSSTSAPEILGPKEVVQKFGVEPKQMIDLLSLMGDSSDHVPGVPRVGQKTAAELLQQFGTLDEVLARKDEIQKPSIRKTITEHEDLALLSRRLVTIDLNVDCGLTIDDIGPAIPDVEELRALFREFEFGTLLSALPQSEAAQNIDKDYRLVRTAEQFDELVKALQDAAYFAVDTETTSLDARHADLVGFSFCIEAGTAFYVPCNLDPPVLAGGRDAIVARLKPLLEDEKLKKVAHNGKYDWHVLRRAGIEAKGLAFDTMLASYCVNAGQYQHNLDVLALKYFDYKKIPTKDLLGTGKKQKTFDEVDVELAAEYAAEDADFTMRLRDVFDEQIDEADVRKVFETIEMPLVPVLLDMEDEGIRVDVELLDDLSKTWQKRIDTIEKRIHERAGREFNLNSPSQIGEVLFDELEVHRAADGKIRPKRTRTGQYKTDADILEKLAAFHEVPALLLEYRRLSKLKGTYVDSLPALVDADTGRIHTSFNQAVAATGRLSSDAPNLQNIPIRTEEGREVRKAFVSRGKGWQLLSADYSQIELRILAHLSGDKALTESFRKGEDIHRRTAAITNGVIPDLVTPEMRNHAKVVNYGLVYGMGPQRLANETGMTIAKAKKFIESYFKALPDVKRWLDATLEDARRNQEVRTMFGRRRLLPDIQSSNAMQRVASENMAVNTPIQGAAADIIKLAMLKVAGELEKRGLKARMLLQVHDELVFDVPEDELSEVEGLVRDGMATAVELSVPLEVEIGHGENWLDAH